MLNVIVDKMSSQLSSSNSCNWFVNYSYAELPMEIILQIFRFLEPSDLQAAGATCQRWREAQLDPKFQINSLVRFCKVCLADRMPPASDFLKCERPFKRLSFEEVSFGPVSELMSHIGRQVVEAHFINADMTDKQFYYILQKLPKLRSLLVSRCSQLFMAGSFLDDNDDRIVVDSTCSKLRHLSLSHNQYLSDAILLRLTALIQCIECLDLSGCHIAYHNAIQRRFYPQDGNSINATVTPSEAILTFKFILKVLALHRPHLRELNLGHTMLGAASMQALCELEGGGLQLLRLKLPNCRQLNTVGLKTFIQTQPQLLLLDLSDTICVNDVGLAAIVTCTPLLEELNIANCQCSDEGAALLGTLKRLKRLNISRCDGIGSKGICEGIAKTSNAMLQELRLANLKICEEGIKALACNLPELRILVLDHCHSGVTDGSVQIIIENLRWLRELSLEECFRLTDAALTGINIDRLQSKQPASDSSRALDGFHPPSSSSLVERDCLASHKISLRTKAEEEIVRDASRKKAVFLAYEQNLIEASDFQGSSVQKICGLRKLNLKGCNKITDVTLKYGLKFIELRSISLSNCQQISLIGISSLVLNCPAIEELDLSDCYNICDKDIQMITLKLTRLRSLNISGCSQLTDHSLDAILVNCKCLQTLSVYRCRSMYTDVEERLSTLPTLRHLNMDTINSMDNAEVFRVRKPMDY